MINNTIFPFFKITAGIITLVIVTCFYEHAFSSEANVVTSEVVAVVEADWEFQESQKNRNTGSLEAVEDLLQRFSHLANDLEKPVPNIDSKRLRNMDEKERTSLYRTLRWQLRETALDNPLLRDTPLVFMKRKRFVCQMLHEYVGYYYENTDTFGGEVCVLENPGRSFVTKNLVGEKLPPGAFATLSLSHDAKTIYFAYTAVSQSENATKPVKWSRLGSHDFHEHTMDFLAGEKGKFQIYAMDITGKNLRQLTRDSYDNFDPQELPEGGLAFLSTRRGGFVRCNNIWEPLPVYTLHRMEVDGANIRTLSFHETNEWHPSVLHDGRIVYSRWDYVDRSAAHYHGLWTSNPDGTLPSVLFGSYTQRVSACYQPRAIPGSRKIMFIAGAHHANTGGSVVILDPLKTAYDPKNAEDSLDCLQRITPDVDFPETPDQWPSTYYHSPWPLSEDYYLVSYSREPLGCFGPGSDETGRTGIYYLDRFGNLELLYEDAETSSQYPIPIAARTPPRVVPDSRDEKLGDTGIVYLADVNKSLVPLPEDRKVTELRVFELLPKWPNWLVDSPRAGHAFAENARKYLGSVPVDETGSVSFSVPANTPMYFQAVDASGKAVQTMRSAVYLQPGERRSCIGCHEPLHSTPGHSSAKLTHEIHSLKPGPMKDGVIDYPSLIQPILDKRCVSCHDGETRPDKNPPDLRGHRKGPFTESYENLKPYLRWYEWGGRSLQQTTTLPGRCGADASPLSSILSETPHKDRVTLTDEELRTIYLWLDANVPFNSDP